MAATCVAAMPLGAPGPALAQPARHAAPPGERPADGALSPDRVRDRIESRLSELRAEEAMLQGALKELDSGEPPMRVARELFRHAREERAGPFEGGPDDREVDPAELTAEKRAAMLAFLRDATPQLAERVERELKANPERADEIYLRMAPRVLPQMELRERDPDLFDLRAKSMRLDWQIRAAAVRLRGTEGDERDAARESLSALVRERVDLTLRERALMLDRFERRLADMRKGLADERARQDQIIAEKVDELMNGDVPPPPRPDADAGPRGPGDLGGPPGEGHERRRGQRGPRDADDDRAP